MDVVNKAVEVTKTEKIVFRNAKEGFYRGVPI